MGRKLHIGGSIRHPKWEVFDVIPAPHVDHVGDARDLSRFEDGTFEAVYASHVLEHFDYKDTLTDAVREWHRVLRPDGKLYVSVPNMAVLADLFLNTDELSVQERFQVMRMMFGGHVHEHDYHYVGFDLEILCEFLGRAGFQQASLVEDFGFFRDTSTLRFKGVLISLNVIATN